MADNCVGPINIIPNNNQVTLQDNNKSITVIDNNCCTEVSVTQPITSVIQVLTGLPGHKGDTGASGSQGPSGSSAPFTYVSGITWSTTSSIEITGSLTISGSNTFKNIGPTILSGSVNVSGSEFNWNGYKIISSDLTSSLSVLSSSYALTASYYDGSVISSSYSSTSSISNQSLSSSYSLTASYVANASSFPYTGSAIITGSLELIGPQTIHNGNLILSSSLYPNNKISIQTQTDADFVTITTLGNDLKFNSNNGTFRFSKPTNGNNILFYGNNGLENLTLTGNTAGTPTLYLSASLDAAFAQNLAIGRSSAYPHFRLFVDGTTGLSGNTSITGSLNVTSGITGSLTGSVTGSLQGSASYALTASYALNSTGGGNVAISNNTGSVVLILDGQGGVITTGQKNYSRLSYSGSFVGWNLMCNPTGALKIDVWVTSSQTSYPTGSNSITDAQIPFITASLITSSTNLTNWTSSFDNGYIIGFNVLTSSLCTWARLELITHKKI